MAHNPKFHGLLRDMAQTHDKKNADYAQDGNPYSNFEMAGELAAKFSAPVDIAFATLIGVKLARLAELKRKGKTPRNESLQDTMLDLAVYAALWASYDYPVEALPTVTKAAGSTLIQGEQESVEDYLKRLDRAVAASWRDVSVAPV